MVLVDRAFEDLIIKKGYNVVKYIGTWKPTSEFAEYKPQCDFGKFLYQTYIKDEGGIIFVNIGMYEKAALIEVSLSHGEYLYIVLAKAEEQTVVNNIAQGEKGCT
jgi:hypothetical protein